MVGAMVDEGAIRERWLIVRDELDERGRRMWAAAEARSHGRGGIAAVVRATGVSEATVRRGIAEVQGGQRAPEGRVRRSGAGRPSIIEREPGLTEALLVLVFPEGVVLNPAAADGLQACSEAQIGFTGFKELNPVAESGNGTAQFTPGLPAPKGSPAQPFCPESSKIGNVTVTTPLLPDKLEGALYLATPAPNR